jgi:predicted TIM-barrel fold metal-dependent hydrolase
MAADSHVRRIATEEAFAIPEQFDAYRALGRSTWSSPDIVYWSRILEDPGNRLIDALLDVDDARIADMDANGVDVQLLLLTSPGVQVLDAVTATVMAARANDLLAEAIARHPDRFAGLATFAPQDPERAAQEMRRVTELGADNIMWAIDYPYQQTPECVEFMDSAPLEREDLEKIYAGNAERVFGIGLPARA